MKRILYYLPRTISVLLVVMLALMWFQSLFARSGIMDILLGFTPVILSLAATTVAFKNPRMGGYAFFGLALLLVTFSLYDYYSRLVSEPELFKPFMTSLAVMSTFLVTTGILFILAKKPDKQRP